MKNINAIKLPSLLIPLVIFGVIVASFIVLAQHVNAASLAVTSVRFDRLHTSTATTGTICAQPSTASTETDVAVTFPVGYTVSSTAGDWTVSTTNLAWPSGATAWPGIGTATTVASQVVTFPSGDLAVGTLYCFNWDDTAAVTTSASASNNNAGVVTTLDIGAATIDVGSYATATITDDQIVVTAVVNPTFTFSLSANTDDLGTLDTAAIASSPTPRTTTVSTNAQNGWIVWAQDDSTGLASVAAGNTISSTTPGTNSTLTAGSEGYNTGVEFVSQIDGSGTVSIDTAFVGGVSGQGGGLDTSLRIVATSDGTADTSVLRYTNNATISPITPAATDYTDTITIVAAGLF